LLKFNTYFLPVAPTNCNKTSSIHGKDATSVFYKPDFRGVFSFFSMMAEQLKVEKEGQSKQDMIAADRTFIFKS